MSTKLISYSHLTFFFLSYIYSRAARIASICQPSIRNGIQVACNVASVRMHSTVKHRCFVEREIFIVKMITFGELFFITFACTFERIRAFKFHMRKYRNVPFSHKYKFLLHIFF